MSEEIEGIEEEIAVEPETPAGERRALTPEEAVRIGTSNYQGHKERWEALAASGATDAELRSAITKECGEQGGTGYANDPELLHYRVEHKGGKNPVITWQVYGDDPGMTITEGKVGGKKLLALVREVYGIGLPGETPVEPDRDATVPESEPIAPETSEIVPESAPEEPESTEDVPTPPDRWQPSRNVETKTLWMPIDGDRAELMDKSLAEQCIELERLREEKSKVNGGFNAKIKTKEAAINKLAESIANGGEQAPVRCRWYYDYTNFRAQLRRDDTDEIVEERPMNDNERQIGMALDEDRHPDDQEGKPEDSEESETRVHAVLLVGQAGTYGGKVGSIVHVDNSSVMFQPEYDSVKVGERPEQIGVGRAHFDKTFSPAGTRWGCTCNGCPWIWLNPGPAEECPSCNAKTITIRQLLELPENWAWKIDNKRFVAYHTKLELVVNTVTDMYMMPGACRRMDEGVESGIVAAKTRPELEKTPNAEESAAADDAEQGATFRNIDDELDEELADDGQVDESDDETEETSPLEEGDDDA